LNAATEGTKVYDDGKNLLQIAIDHYDQVVVTAAMVAGTTSSHRPDTLEMRMNQKAAQAQLQEEKFLKWLSPSYWLAE
jgi:hypothetical protein